MSPLQAQCQPWRRSSRNWTISHCVARWPRRPADRPWDSAAVAAIALTELARQGRPRGPGRDGLAVEPMGASANAARMGAPLPTQPAPPSRSPRTHPEEKAKAGSTPSSCPQSDLEGAVPSRVNRAAIETGLLAALALGRDRRVHRLPGLALPARITCTSTQKLSWPRHIGPTVRRPPTTTSNPWTNGLKTTRTANRPKKWRDQMLLEDVRGWSGLCP